MKKELRQALFVANIALVLLWPVSAWAATLTFGAQMATIPLLDVLMTLVLSILSGITSLLHAMKEAYKKDGTIDRLGLFVTSKLFGSILAGLLMFLYAEMNDWPQAKQAIGIIVSSFAGTLGLERVTSWALNRYLPEPPK